MVLKEAYQYQNYLTSLIDEAKRYLSAKDFVTETVQKHYRQKVNIDAENETVVVKSSYNVDFEPSDLLDFIMKALAEKQKLSDAIVAAKRSVDIDIDAAISMNKYKQTFMTTLQRMADIRSTETEARGTDYKFDVNGEQKAYCYPVSQETTIKFDRNDVRCLIKKLRKETDEVSTKLDTIQITTEVKYCPIWAVGDTLEECVQSQCASLPPIFQYES